MARHAGVELEPDVWQDHGYDLPLLVNMQPAGKYLGERFHRAGGVPAAMWELMQAGKLEGGAATCTGRSMAENLAGCESHDREMIRRFADRSEEHTSELQSLMRISYAVFCLKKKKNKDKEERTIYR